MRPEFLALLLLACGGSTDTDTDAACAPGLEIGTGIAAFEPLEALDELEIVHGPQGGYHLPGAVRTCGLVDGSHEIRFVAVEEETGLVVTDVTYARQVRPEGRCCGYVADIIGYLYIPVEPYVDPADYLDGQVVVLTMSATDAEGGTVDATLRVVARRPPLR